MVLLGASVDLCGSAEARDPEVLWSGGKPQRWDLWKEEGIRPGLAQQILSVCPVHLCWVLLFSCWCLWSCR